MPTYRPVERFETLVMPVRRTRRGAARGAGPHALSPGFEVEGVADCIARNARRFQFAPRWDEDELASLDLTRGLTPDDYFLRRSGDRTGCLAVWDQRAFKQVVVRGYESKLARVRPLFNLIAPLLGRPRLPAVGQPLNVGYVSHLAIDADDPRLFAELLAEAHARAAARGLAYLAIGLSSRHPLLPIAKKLYGHRRSTATLYAVHWDDGAGAAAALDGRVAHYEVALL
jgi:hypothetical protein